jgi:peptide/nickel transport system permease protein
MMVRLQKPNIQLWAGLFILIAISVLTVVSPWIAKYDPDIQNEPALNRYQRPGPDHWFGTDQFGRDVFSRVLNGGRISFLIALSVVLLSAAIGSLYGAVSGYFGGLLDQFLMRLVDLFLSFPILFLSITCMALFGTGIPMLITVLTLTGWMDIARLVRAEVHSLKHRPFILKARASGLKTPRIIRSHLLNNVLATLTVFCVVRLADIIMIESALSFIGLGVQPPTASWGSIINDGRPVLGSAWWLTFFPGCAILLTTLSLNLVGNGMKWLRE